MSPEPAPAPKVVVPHAGSLICVQPGWTTQLALKYIMQQVIYEGRGRDSYDPLPSHYTLELEIDQKDVALHPTLGGAKRVWVVIRIPDLDLEGLC